MAKVLLIQPPWCILQGIKSETASLGLASLAAVLENRGHQVLIFNGEPPHNGIKGNEHVVSDINDYIAAHDLNNPVWDRFKNTVRSFRPDIAGISIWTGAYKAGLNVAKICKAHNKGMPVVAGGPHPTLAAQEMLEDNPEIDFIVAQEGEETMPDLVSSLQNGPTLDKVAGIYYRDNGRVVKNQGRPFIEDLDRLPFASFQNVLDYERYSPDAFASIITSRGCPYFCSYCASYHLWSRKVRFRSPKNVVDEIQERMEIFGTTNFRFNDDTFVLKKERVFAICGLILSRRLNIRWQCDARVDLLDKALLKIMKKAGCHQINLGVESADSGILSRINKDITLNQARGSVKLARSLGIDIAIYFMLGFPDETKEQAASTIRLMRELNPHVPIYSLVTPYPGTEIYEYSKKNGLLPSTKDWSLYFHHSAWMKLSNHIAEADWQALINQIDRHLLKSRHINEIRWKRRAFFKRFGYKNVWRALRIRVLSLRHAVLKNLKSFFFIALNKGKIKCGASKAYYGFPEGIAIKTAAFLKIEKLKKYFPEHKRGFNLIYTINGSYPDYAICKYAKRSGMPIVYNVNGICYRAWYGPGWERQNAIMRKTYDIADYIIFQSKFSKLSAETFLGKPQCKWEILYNAVNTNQFMPSDRESGGGLVILCAGNHIVFQPLAAVIEAFQIVKKEYQGARLIIAGRLWSGRGHFHVDGRAQQLVYKMGLEGSVEFQPYYSQQEAPDIYRQAGIFITCRYAEPCPSAVIEAMACGLSVVYSASGGTPELVGPDAGIGIPVKLDWDYYQVPAPYDVADAVMKIIKDRDAISCAARNRAVQYFDIRHWIERHRQIFNSLV